MSRIERRAAVEAAQSIGDEAYVSRAGDAGQRSDARQPGHEEGLGALHVPSAERDELGLRHCAVDFAAPVRVEGMNTDFALDLIEPTVR